MALPPVAGALQDSATWVFPAVGVTVPTLEGAAADTLSKSNPTSKVYSLTSSPAVPTTNIFVPSVLNARPVELSSWLCTEKASVKEQVETSKPVEHAYSLTSSPALPVTNIFVPSELNVRPWGDGDWADTEKASVKEQVETSKAVHAYSLTSFPVLPTTNIFVPSELNARPWGFVSWAFTEKASVRVQVDTSKPVLHAYSFTSSPKLSTTNIFVPSVLNARPIGSPWTPLLSVKIQVDTSNAVHAYSLTSFPESPTTNIFVPSVLNATPVGSPSWNFTEKASTKVVAANASLIGIIKLDKSKTDVITITPKIKPPTMIIMCYHYLNRSLIRHNF